MAEQVPTEVIVNSLKDVTETWKWYKVQIPSLTGVSPRVGHSMVQVGHKVVMIGGANNESGGAMNDIWFLDLIILMEGVVVNPFKPEEKKEETGDKSSSTKPYFAPRYEFSCTKVPNEKPDDRCPHLSEKTDIVVFGGSAENGDIFNDVFLIGEEKCECIFSGESGQVESVPSGRTQGGNSGFVDWNEKKCIPIFGGGLRDQMAIEDGKLYVFEVEEPYDWHVVPVGSATPPPVQGHSIFSHENKVFVFGGMNMMQFSSDLYVIDLNAKDDNGQYNWVKNPDKGDNDVLDVPCPRAVHGITKVTSVGESPTFYLFGGLRECGDVSNDLWAFDPVSLVWTDLNSRVQNSACEMPLPRMDFAFCTLRDQNHTYLLMHGGMDVHGEMYNDMWVLKIA